MPAKDPSAGRSSKSMNIKSISRLEEDFHPGDDSNIASLSTEFHSRRLYLAFVILPFMFCTVSTAICTMFLTVTSSSLAFVLILPLLWCLLFKAIRCYAPSEAHMSQALYRTCYNPSFMIKLSLLVKLAVYWLLPRSPTATRYTTTVTPLLIFTFHVLIAMSCISIAAYFRFRAGPFTLLSCSPIPLLRYADQSSTSIVAALRSFLSDVMSSESASSTESFTVKRGTTKGDLPTTSVARTLILTPTDDAVMVVPNTLDAHPSHIGDSNANLYSNHLKVFRVIFFQSLSHATLGAFFGAHLLFALQALGTRPSNNVSIIHKISNYMNNDMTIAVQLAGAASFLAFFDVIRPRSDIDLRRYMKFVYNDCVDNITATKVIIKIITSIWDESKGILLTSITRLIVTEFLLIGIIVSYLLLGSTSFLLNYSSSTLVGDISHLLLLQVAVRQMIYIVKYLAICTIVYFIGLCGSVFVDTLSRVILSQPIVIKSLCKEYRRIIARKAQKGFNGSASVSQSLTSSTIPDVVQSKTGFLPIQTRLFLDCTALLLCDGTTTKSCRQKMIDILVGATFSGLQRNRPFASFGLDPGSLEVHRTENAMHLLAESWLCSTGNVMDNGKVLPIDLYRELLLESLGGDDELSLHPRIKTYDPSTSMILARHVSSIESCLLSPDSGIIISRCLITLAGAYGILLTEISSTGSKELLFTHPSLVSHAEMCVRAAARMILVSTQFSVQYSRQSLMALALLRAAYRLHLGASYYGKHERELLHSNGVRGVTDATPLGQHRQQMRASKASYLIQEVSGCCCSNMQYIRRQLCTYEIDQMKGYSFFPVFVYRLLVAADEAVVLLASSGVLNDVGQDMKHHGIGATNSIRGLDRGCQAWINEVLLVASSVDGDPDRVMHKVVK